MSESATLPLPGHAKVEVARTEPARRPKAKAPALPAVHTDAKLGREADLIVKYWREQEPVPLKPVAIPDGAVLSSLCVGLGDTLMLTDLLRAGREAGKEVRVLSTSPHFRPLMRFNPGWKEPDQADQGLLVNAASLVRHYDCGNGHYLQRIRRAFGFPVEDVPRACVAWSGQRHKNRVIVHFDPGVHALWQRKTIHPNARRLLPASRAELETFIKSEPGLDFVTVGAAPDKVRLKGTRHIHTPTLAHLVETVGAASWHIGILSGPLHLAVALGLRVVTVLDWPEGWKVFLPTLRATRQGESEWLVPQSVVLHQTSSGPLCPSFTALNLKKAFAGEVWPRWQTAHCSLIHERLDP